MLLENGNGGFGEVEARACDALFAASHDEYAR